MLAHHLKNKLIFKKIFDIINIQNKGRKKMNKDLKRKIIEARINLLSARGPHNAAIVAKLKRQLRALEA